MIHACQTESGTSGAPLFTIDQATGELVLVGLHLRFIQVDGDPGSCARGAATAGLPNLGLSLPNELRQLIVDLRSPTTQVARSAR